MAKPSKELREYLASLGRKAGKARIRQITADERKELAQKTAKARWSKGQRGG